MIFENAHRRMRIHTNMDPEDISRICIELGMNAEPEVG
jgi:hypothetical protein